MNKPMIVKVADVEGVKRDPPRVSRLLLSGKNVGAKNASMGLNVTEVGSMIPPHKHEESEELMYIISGHARLVIENDEGGEDVYEIGPDTALLGSAMRGWGLRFRKRQRDPQRFAS